MKGIAAGIAGGVAGAFLWGIIAVLTGYEIGWIAWGIGALVGAGVAWGTAGGTVPGVLAVVISVLSILGGKFVAMEIAMDKEIKTANQGIAAQIDGDEEYLVTWLANTIIYQMQEKGMTIDWPAGVDPENPQSKEDYPPVVWQQAQSTWKEMNDQEKSDYKENVRQQVAQNVRTYADRLRQEGFLASFGPIDIIFFILAIATAYKVGSKNQTNPSE